MSDHCGNPDCGNQGTRKCSACSLVSYCGPACQKAHWPQHKKQCKSKASGGSSSSQNEIVAPVQSKPQGLSNERVQLSQQAVYEIVQKLQFAKQETQRTFNSGDFIGSVKFGSEALQHARMLPDPGSTIECVQIHLNMATAYLQLNKPAEAKIHSSLCVEIAERGVQQRPTEPQAIEMLVVALGCRTFVLLHEIGDSDDKKKAEEAETFAAKALMLAEKIYPENDTRLFKPLRMLGLIRDKQGKFDSAVETLHRAYLAASQGHGPAHQESQLAMDDLIATLVKKAQADPTNSTIAAAGALSEKYARMNYDAVVRSELEKGHLVIGDSAGRLSTVLARLGREVEAEPLMRKSLEIREKHMGASHPLVGITLGFLAGILEGQEKYGDETEKLLLRAVEIFKKADVSSEGAGGAGGTRHLHSALAHLQRIRMKRQGIFSGQGYSQGQPVETMGGYGAPEVEDDDSDVEDLVVTSESKMDKVTVKSKAASGSGSGSGSGAGSGSGKSSGKEEKGIEFHPDDGIGRMRQAAVYFETQEFRKAEIVLAEAFAIFNRDNGPNHQSTMAAKQNLEVVRGQALIQLWQEVAREELERLKLSPSGGSAPASASASASASSTEGADSSANGADSPSASATTGAGASNSQEASSGGEVSWAALTASPASAEDAWLLKVPEKQSGCAIC